MNKYWGLLISTFFLIAVSGFESYAVEAVTEPDNNQVPSEQTLHIEPVMVVAEPDGQRKDLDPDSITNLYRVESTARFGTEVFTEKDIKELQPSDVYDLLDKAVGMNLSYQGRKHPFFIDQRGGGSFHLHRRRRRPAAFG